MTWFHVKTWLQKDTSTFFSFFSVPGHKTSKTEIALILIASLHMYNQALATTCLQCKSFETTVGKEEIAHNEQFLQS